MAQARQHSALTDEAEALAHHRVRGFTKHMAAYFFVIVVSGAVNLLGTPEKLWVLFPMLGWSPVLAIHAAYAMGLFAQSNG